MAAKGSDVGQLANDDDTEPTTDAGAAVPGLWLDLCEVCGVPVTVVAATKPISVRCDRCQTPTT